ncbi:MAG: Acetyl-coenzyme carboxylase carboxyl transferase subunit beta [Bacteriovoracaceae bacterium]|nr:Acetyl-coenzyme carboxylase carboxyl transferase subunit beta [Bacteriovoracaceae bacterium]
MDAAVFIQDLLSLYGPRFDLRFRSFGLSTLDPKIAFDFTHFMSWVKDLKSPGIQTRVVPSESKAPSQLWTKCLDCGAILYRVEIERSRFVCPTCDFHFLMPARQRVELLTDNGSFKEHDSDLVSTDPLKFVDQASYSDRLLASQKKTGENDAAIWGDGIMDGMPFALSVFIFEFMGGSMGSVVGEKITRCFEYALEKRVPAIVISSSGGARMQEGIYSLMQLVKTCAALQKMKREGIPYISLLAHPTTGGVAASFAMLGDINIAEPGALIGFAGPRVIEQTIRQKLPPGFQRASFLLEHGMVDQIVHRRDQKKVLSKIFKILSKRSA